MTRYSTAPFSKLSKVGIRHPPPLPFIGNLLFFREGWSQDLPLPRLHLGVGSGGKDVLLQCLCT
uniref:Uncharacterized protein n=1 Tax=Meleagris gallopavo TaxID=9103 RepID=A0A803Y8K7_MELGA